MLYQKSYKRIGRMIKTIGIDLVCGWNAVFNFLLRPKDYTYPDLTKKLL